jgi:hypothetical protein
MHQTINHAAYWQTQAQDVLYIPLLSHTLFEYKGVLLASGTHLTATKQKEDKQPVFCQQH